MTDKLAPDLSFVIFRSIYVCPSCHRLIIRNIPIIWSFHDAFGLIPCIFQPLHMPCRLMSYGLSVVLSRQSIIVLFSPANVVYVCIILYIFKKINIFRLFVIYTSANFK